MPGKKKKETVWRRVVIRNIRKELDNVFFDAKALRELKKTFDSVAKELELEPIVYSCSSIKDRQTTYFHETGDGLAAFLASLQDKPEIARVEWSTQNSQLHCAYGYQRFSGASLATLDVKAPNREAIERLLATFDDLASVGIESFKLKNEEKSVFIGHGRSDLWRDLKDHLRDQHSVEVVAYETGARAGHTIRDILEEMVSKSSIAFLIHTAEDELVDQSVQARANVIHETGLFQGKLGFSRAIVVLEEGANEFSNISGIQQIRFSKGRIRETFGDILATIRREFGE